LRPSEWGSSIFIGTLSVDHARRRKAEKTENQGENLQGFHDVIPVMLRRTERTKHLKERHCEIAQSQIKRDYSGPVASEYPEKVFICKKMTKRDPDLVNYA
jgi:hypothetical protein